MVGFKSFADKTSLKFEPGMTAVVGPNGCGKSNIADAVRWVIGEQSAKAMRGSSMTDCIFNGTDDRKPLGMAEVSITLADCEETLGTDYNEVTISRRVFRSGEGQYFINKTPCRLKDIQRLFMDTGIGTTSYSLMEQGRIDRVLSARPEDRRAVFEEASGITKYKADKKEALRKLDHTEANLVRLADVIREVKRQIGSLQRQAGKARRYKAIREELRNLDILTTRDRLAEADKEIHKLEAELSSLTGKANAAHREVEELEEKNAELHENLLGMEREIGAVLETRAQAQNNLDRSKEQTAMNRQRVEEYRAYTERDTNEIEETRRQLATSREAAVEIEAQHAEASRQCDEAEKHLKDSQGSFSVHRQTIDDARTRIQRLREESVQLESNASRLQNQLLEIESRERAAVIEREKLGAERKQLEHVSATYTGRQAEMAEQLESMTRDVQENEANLARLVAERAELERSAGELQQRCAQLQSDIAARHARVEMLQAEDESADDFPGGARLVMDDANPLGVDRGTLLGSLAESLDIDDGYGAAVEAVLRPWLDALLVRDASGARSLLQSVSQARKGPIRILAASDAAEAPPAPEFRAGEPLLSHVRFSSASRPVCELLATVAVVDSLNDVPSPVPAAQTYVTRDGAMLSGSGALEFWMPDSRVSNPLSRRNALNSALSALENLESQLAEHKQSLTDARSRSESIANAIDEARTVLDAARRSAAQKEGENQVLVREAKEARDRLDTVTWELENLLKQDESGESEKDSIRNQLDEMRRRREQMGKDIQEQTRELGDLELRHTDLQSEMTEHRIAYASHSQRVEYLAGQQQAIGTRVAELEANLRGRSEGVKSYQANIERLTAEIKRAEEELSTLEQAVAENSHRGDRLRTQRDDLAEELKQQETVLAQRRTYLEELRTAKSSVDIRCAEGRMRRQTQLDRVMSDYNVTIENIRDEEEPDWPDGKPSIEDRETRIAELRTKLEAMGPVNLVAIEEYQELEERYAELTEQEQDIVKAKQQLMDMIRKINRTSAEMFKTTFDQINLNFQAMFKRLFNGGTAQLVLVNEEDILECGIEIIARPPGKRLQNISLLSGGERTLTAVALLFSIYMIKPSPFCLLDELDAPLDDSNIGRFVDVLQGFLKQSQFLIITHNQHTISTADLLYGVTMQQKGVSKIVSMRFRDHAGAEPASADRPEETAPDEELAEAQ